MKIVSIVTPIFFLVALCPTTILVAWLRLEGARAAIRVHLNRVLFIWAVSWSPMSVYVFFFVAVVDGVVIGYASALSWWLWWKSGGGDRTRRWVSKLTGAVTVTGSRLAIVPMSACR